MLQVLQNLFTVVLIINALITMTLVAMIILIIQRQKRLLVLLGNGSTETDNGTCDNTSKAQLMPEKQSSNIRGPLATRKKPEGTLSHLALLTPQRIQEATSERTATVNTKSRDEVKQRSKPKRENKSKKVPVNSKKTAAVIRSSSKCPVSGVRVNKSRINSRRAVKTSIKSLSGAEAEMMAAMENR